MKSTISTLLLNLGFKKQAAQADSVVRGAASKASVEAAVPSTLPTV